MHAPACAQWSGKVSFCGELSWISADWKELESRGTREAFQRWKIWGTKVCRLGEHRKYLETLRKTNSMGMRLGERECLELRPEKWVRTGVQGLGCQLWSLRFAVSTESHLGCF